MVSREQLYALVWSKPMTKIAEQFEVAIGYRLRVHPRRPAGSLEATQVGKRLKQSM